jgi:hypothetical protein
MTSTIDAGSGQVGVAARHATRLGQRDLEVGTAELHLDDAEPIRLVGLRVVRAMGRREEAGDGRDLLVAGWLRERQLRDHAARLVSEKVNLGHDHAACEMVKELTETAAPLEIAAELSVRFTVAVPTL